MKRGLIVSLGSMWWIGGCTPLPPGVRAPTEVWAVDAPGPIGSSIVTADSARAASASGISAAVDSWIALDTVSFRPTLVLGSAGSRRGADEGATLSQPPAGVRRRLSVVTSFQGSRYHPDVIRGLTESSDAVALAAGSIASLLSASETRVVILDFQEMTAADIQILVDVSRAIADSARSRGIPTVAMMIPAADSSGYPARTLARIADLMLVKLFPEHGVTTPAGAIVSPSWFTRRLGLRASEAGVNRIVAGIPADGLIWDARGGARRIAYLEALRLATEANTRLVRDPASGNLHAVSNRDGWEIWVADHELIERLIAEGRRLGVTRFALSGLDGADPEILERLPGLVIGSPGR